MQNPKLILPKRKPSSRKGQNGTVLAIGGSKRYPGAILLASLSALRSGCDIVKVISPLKVAWAINSYSPDLITIKANGHFLGTNHFNIIKKEAENCDIILIGNGMGLMPSTKKLCKKIISSSDKLKVIDADAIKSISLNDCKNSILTPHSRELEIFLANSGIPKEIILKISKEENFTKKSNLIKVKIQKFLEQNNIVLLKGKTDAIISKNKIVYVTGGNCGMTKGGTGDVLAGICAGFLAQSKDLLQSAINASILNKKIADILLKKKKGFTYLASDMVEEIRKIKNTAI